MVKSTHHRLLIICSLILAGEAIFSLPFHITRFFRPTVLEVFGFSNANLGDVFAVYGVTAMLAYFPGGAIADRFAGRSLLALSLIATAAGGLYMATVPGIIGMSILFGYWGVTTILLFWAALIRSTREWGGELSQGRAFGLLDGGRGLLAAGLASIAVVIFAATVPNDINFTDPIARRAALVSVIYFYCVITFAVGILIWFLLPDRPNKSLAAPGQYVSNIRGVLRDHIVWAQAAIVIVAYCAYKGLDNYALYAVEVLGMSEVEAAQFTATSAYIRPVAAVVAGILADRLSASRITGGLFIVLAASFGYLAIAAPVGGADGILFANIFISFAGVYGLRGVYFALLAEAKIAPSVTGTAVGLISLVGYTPDIFFASIGGRLLDNAPGLSGHQHYFIFLGSIMLLGLVAVAVLIRLGKRRDVSKVSRVRT